MLLFTNSLPFDFWESIQGHGKIPLLIEIKPLPSFSFSISSLGDEVFLVDSKAPQIPIKKIVTLDKGWPVAKKNAWLSFDKIHFEASKKPTPMAIFK